MFNLNKIYSAIDYTKNQAAPWMKYASEKCTKGVLIAKVAARTLYQYAQVLVVDLSRVNKKEICQKGLLAGSVAALCGTAISQGLLALSEEESEVAENSFQTLVITACATQMLFFTQHCIAFQLLTGLTSYDQDQDSRLRTAAVPWLYFATETVTALALSTTSRALVSPSIGEASARRMSILAANTVAFQFFRHIQLPIFEIRLSIANRDFFKAAIAFPMPFAAMARPFVIASEPSFSQLATAGGVILATIFTIKTVFPITEDPIVAMRRFSFKHVMRNPINLACSTTVGFASILGRNFFGVLASLGTTFMFERVGNNIIQQVQRIPGPSFRAFWHLNVAQQRRVEISRAVGAHNIPVLRNIVDDYLEGDEEEQVQQQNDIIEILDA